MSENPFEPPNTVSLPPHVASKAVARKSARVAFRILTLIFTVAALYNYLEYDAAFIMGSRLPSLTVLGFRAVNLSAMLLGVLLVWFLGFPLVEQASLLLRALLGRQTDQEEWQDQLYLAIHRATILSIPGSVAWLIWVFGFYRLGINFYVISWAMGIPAYLLGAAVVIPLGYGWYRLTRSDAR